MFCVRVMSLVRRQVLFVVAISVMSTTQNVGAQLPRECGGDPMPAPPVNRQYRTEPEEESIATAVLLRHFKDHPVLPKTPVCVTLPGHKPPTRGLRRALKEAGILVDPREDCRYEEGRVMWAAAGVWKTQPETFKAHVEKLEFGHLSLFLEGYEYTVRATGEVVSIVSVQGSACNPDAKRRQ